MNPDDPDVRQPPVAARAHESAALEPLERLSARLAHDFNNVLQIIGGNLHLLNSAVAGNAAAERRLASAIEGVASGAVLTAGLQAFAGRQANAPELVVLSQELSKCEPRLRALLGPAIAVDLNVDPNAGAIRVDPARFHETLLALAANARDAMPEGGKFSIRVAPEGGMSMLTISDSGRGMSASERESAREPFYSTKPKATARGLGLSTVHGFVRQSRGHLEISSETGRGTSIRIAFPRADLQAAMGASATENAVSGHAPAMGAAAHAGMSAPSQARHTLSVLYVEDNLILQRSLLEFFEELGHRVVATINAEDALTALATREFDLLFTDISLPGMSGLDLAREAARRWPRMRLVLASGYGRQLEVRRVKEQIGEGVVFLPKPFDLAALNRVLSDIAAGGAR